MGRATAVLLAAAVILWTVAAVVGRGAEWVAVLGLLAFAGALVVGFTGTVLTVAHYFTRPRARHGAQR